MHARTTSPSAHAKPIQLAAAAKLAVAVLAVMLVGCAGGCSSSSDSATGSFNQFVNKIIHKFHGGGSPTQEAAELFHSQNPSAQMAAIAYFQSQPYGHQKIYMEAYRKLFANNPDPLVRGQAMLALGTSGQASVAPILVKNLGDPSKFVRMCSALALTYVNNPIAIDPLIDHLTHDPSRQVRMYSIEALKYYKAHRVLVALIDTLNSDNVAEVQLAWNNLTSETGQKFAQHPGPWRRWLSAPHPSQTRPS
ncbi:MAG: HEAT repeat domain-containing protein [Phycisphaerae bacterium]